MPPTQLPEGRYLNCPIDLSPDAGGQTRALLMRNRMFVTEAGISPSILTFNARTDLDVRREVMLERKLLLDEIDTPNIYAHYREHDWDEDGAAGKELLDLSHHKFAEETFPNGEPWRIAYRVPGQRHAVFDYQRPDGTTYLRIPHFIFKQPATWPTSVQRVSKDGTVIGEFGSIGQWFRRWIRELTAGARSFVFVDSRYNAQHIIPMRAPHIHLIYVLHNIHVAAPRNWSSDLSDIYRRLLARVGGTDAMVTLTQRQNDDIAERRGRTSNLFVVPNPVDMPDAQPDMNDRDPNLVTVVARLEGQKRLTHAVAAFAKVVAQVPTARLDIYGEGKQRPLLEEAVRKHGLEHAVTLRGHDPRARDALWRSSAFLMTSMFEGYPLSTLESLSHGCPVVSYDIKYGPREQVTDGVDGFLVPEGDTTAMAERVVQLLRSPELVQKMSAAAVEKARQHGTGQFMADWERVIRSAIELKPFRTRLDQVELEMTSVRVARGGRLRRLMSESGELAPTADDNDRLELEGVLHVEGRSQRATLDSAQLQLSAVHRPSGWLAELPLSIRLVGNEFRFKCSAPIGQVLPRRDGPDSVELRLRLVWHNSSWETLVARPEPRNEGVWVAYASDDTLRVSRA